MYVMIKQTMTLILNDDNTDCHVFLWLQPAAAYRARGINTFYS